MCDILPFSFPRVVLSAQVCVLSPNPAEPGWLSVHAHKLAAKAGTHHWWGRIQGASHGVEVIGEVPEHWGYQ